jgi:hypothetical protein
MIHSPPSVGVSGSSSFPGCHWSADQTSRCFHPRNPANHKQKEWPRESVSLAVRDVCCAISRTE